MLTKIDHKDLPEPGGRQRSEMRNFAYDTLTEFVQVAEIGDVMEVTGFPVLVEDERANIEKLMSAFSTEHRYIPECEGYVRSFRRKGRVFLRMEEPLSVQAARNRRKYAEAEAKVAKEYARKPNPYPGD